MTPIYGAALIPELGTNNCGDLPNRELSKAQLIHPPITHSSTNPRKMLGYPPVIFISLTLGLSPHPLLKNHQCSSSSSGKRPDMTQIAGEGVWGLLFGFGVSLFQASMGSAELEPSQGSHAHSCKILTWNGCRSGQTWVFRLIRGFCSSATQKGSLRCFRRSNPGAKWGEEGWEVP